MVTRVAHEGNVRACPFAEIREEHDTGTDWFEYHALCVCWLKGELCLLAAHGRCRAGPEDQVRELLT